MERVRLPPAAGIAGAVLAVVLVLAPYALPDASATDVNTYYGHGLVGPWLVVICAVLAVVVYASGLQERTPHDTAAGAGLTLGIAMVLFGAIWVTSVPLGDVRPVTANWWFGYHRWAVVGVAAVVPAAGVWYARVLRLF